MGSNPICSTKAMRTAKYAYKSDCACTESILYAYFHRANARDEAGYGASCESHGSFDMEPGKR